MLLARDRVIVTAPTLAAWSETYLDPVSGWLGGVTEGTRDGYRKAAGRSFLPILGEVPLDRITKQDVARWVHWQESRPSIARPGERVSAKTVLNYQAPLSAMLAAAVEAGHLPGNVARGVRLTAGVRG